jgi:hypothetical protein
VGNETQGRDGAASGRFSGESWMASVVRKWMVARQRGWIARFLLG